MGVVSARICMSVCMGALVADEHKQVSVDHRWSHETVACYNKRVGALGEGLGGAGLISMGCSGGELSAAAAATTGTYLDR